MWSLLLRKAILCVLYVLLLYCDVIVLSQRLRMYDNFDTNDLLTNHRSHNGASYSDNLLETNVSTRTPLIHRTKASDNSQYIHGMTYEEHKKIAAASEPFTQYRRHRFNVVNAPSVPSWRRAITTEAPTTEGTTVAELPHSYFGTTRKPLVFNSDSYWPERYGSGNRVKPTIRVESTLNSTFGQARIETGLKPRNPCCENETDSNGDQNRGKFRFYNSFSRERGYAPHRAVQLVTTTTTSTTDHPVHRWNERYDSSHSFNQFHEKASSMGLSSSRRIVGARENSASWITTKSPYRHYTTTWVPRTTRDRIDNTAFNTLWNTNRLAEVDVEPYHPPGSLPRSGFDGVRGIRPWDDRPISTTTTSTTTRRPATLDGLNVDEYDYYDELEKRQTSTTKLPKYPWLTDWRRTTVIPTTPRSVASPAQRSNSYDHWISQGRTSTSTTPTPYVEYPPGPIYKPYDEDRDFEEWKSQVEKKVQRIRKPSGKTRTPASRIRVTGSPSLENDLVPLFRVSGVEEEDWKFIHETNSLEDTFQSPVKQANERYRSQWRDSLSSDWPEDRKESRNEPFSFSTPRRNTRTTAVTTTRTTTTEPPSTESWTLPPTTLSMSSSENSTSPPKIFVPPTRRFVPRKPAVSRRRTTPGSRSGPRYSFRLYTPPGSVTEDSTSTESSLLSTSKASTVESLRSFPSPYHTESHYPPSADIFASNTFITTPRGTQAPATTSTTESPSTTTSTTPSTRTTSTTPYFTAPSIIPPRSATTIAKENPSSSTPVGIHWLTTRKPVFGEGMSIEEQLAEAMRRLQERQKNKELEKKQKEAEKAKRKEFDGSGDWENEILNDAPIIVESVPEVADLDLQRDFSVEQDVKKRISRNVGDAEIFGELVDEHVMQVDRARRGLEPGDRDTRSA